MPFCILMSGHCGGKRGTPAIRERFDIMCSTPTLPPRTLSCYNPFSLLPSTIKSKPSHLVHVNSHHIGNALFNMVITLSLPTTAIYSLPTFKHGIKSKLFFLPPYLPFPLIDGNSFHCKWDTLFSPTTQSATS